MALDGKLLGRARERLAQRREENEAREAALRREIFARLPEVRRTDAALNALLREVVDLTGGGPDRARQLRDLDRESLELIARRAEQLRAGGYPADALDGVYTCRRCRDTGYLADGRPCACLLKLYEAERSAALSQLGEAGSRGFEGFDLSYYEGEDRSVMELTLSNARKFAREFSASSPNLLLQGGTGLGKTLLCRCIAAAVAEMGASVVFETAQSAFSAFEDQKFSRDAEAYAAAGDRVRRILGCELLILDDLGTELTTSFTQSALYNIVDTRLTQRRKTVISTNLSDEELARRYIPQVVSRIAGEYDTLLFRGRDVRAQQREKRYR